MFLKKTTCLLLTFVFICALAVPSFADGNPPPTDTGNIHPWDNNDEFRYSSGPLLVQERSIWFGYGFNGQLVTFSKWTTTGLIKMVKSDSSSESRQSAKTLRVVTTNR